LSSRTDGALALEEKVKLLTHLVTELKEESLNRSAGLERERSGHAKILDGNLLATLISVTYSLTVLYHCTELNQKLATVTADCHRMKGEQAAAEMLKKRVEELAKQCEEGKINDAALREQLLKVSSDKARAEGQNVSDQQQIKAMAQQIEILEKGIWSFESIH
jgi:hypothetical protein